MRITRMRLVMLIALVGASPAMFGNTLLLSPAPKYDQSTNKHTDEAPIQLQQVDINMNYQRDWGSYHNEDAWVQQNSCVSDCKNSVLQKFPLVYTVAWSEENLRTELYGGKNTRIQSTNSTWISYK